jgi:hypothetical protein
VRVMRALAWQARMAWAISGTPPIMRTFFRGMALEPPRAGMIAKTRVSSPSSRVDRAWGCPVALRRSRLGVT